MVADRIIGKDGETYRKVAVSFFFYNSCFPISIKKKGYWWFDPLTVGHFQVFSLILLGTMAHFYNSCYPCILGNPCQIFSEFLEKKNIEKNIWKKKWMHQISFFVLQLLSAPVTHSSATSTVTHKSS